jgi:hypothetical protein
MRSDFIRRLKLLERAHSRPGHFQPAWRDEGTIIPLASPEVIPIDGDIWQRTISYSRLDSQRRFDEIPSTFKGFSGPVGSGKSKALCHEVIKCAYLNPGVPGLLGAPTEKLLHNSTLIQLLSILDEQDIPYRKTGNRVLLTEPDSPILLVSLDSPERLRNMNLGWFGIDELTYCKEAAWLRLQARIRHPQARYRKGFAVWTPNGRDWVWQRFISARKLHNHDAVRAAPFENKFVIKKSPEYYEDLRNSYDEKLYHQEVLGEYLDLSSGSVYHAFTAENVRECTFNPLLPLIVALDFNVLRMSGLLLQCESSYGRKKVNVLQEIVLPHSHTGEWCEQLSVATAGWVEALNGRALKIELYGDATGGSTQANSGGNSNWDIVERFLRTRREYELRSLYKKSNPAVVNRVNAVNAMLCSEAERDRKERRLFIDPSCSELVADLEEVKWRVDAHGNAYDKIDKRNSERTHTSDALGYYIETEHGTGFGGKAIRQTL